MDRLGLKAEDEVVRLLIGLLMVNLEIVTVLLNGEVVGVGNKGGSWVGLHEELFEVMSGAASGGDL